MTKNRSKLALSVFLALAMMFVAAVSYAQESEHVSSESLTGLDSTNADTATRTWTVNLMDCRDYASDNPTIKVEFNISGTPGSDDNYAIKLQHGGETCATGSLDTGDDVCLLLESSAAIPSNGEVTATRTWQLMTGIDSASECTNVSDTYDFILIFNPPSSTSEETTTDFHEIRVELDTSRPSAPTTVTAEAAASQIQVSWGEVTGAKSYRVYYSATEAFAAGDEPEGLSSEYEAITSGSDTDAVLDEDIAVNTTYRIAVTAIDDHKNESLLSEVVTETTQPVTDFYELYRGRGGMEEGGFCTVIGQPSTDFPWALGAVGFVYWLRRRTAGAGA